MNLKPLSRTASPISTHQLLPLKSQIVWVGLWWLVGILMWCRLLVFLFPLAVSQTLAKTLVGKVITHRQLCCYLPKQWGKVAIFKGLHSEPCLHTSTSIKAMCYITRTPASTVVTCSHVTHFLMLMCLSSTLFRGFTFMSNKSKYLELANSTWLVYQEQTHCVPYSQLQVLIVTHSACRSVRKAGFLHWFKLKSFSWHVDSCKQLLWLVKISHAGIFGLFHPLQWRLEELLIVCMHQLLKASSNRYPVFSARKCERLYVLIR